LARLLDYEALARFLRDLDLPSHERFLDLACGPGLLLQALASVGRWSVRLGIEIEPQVAERARNLAVGTTIVTGDVFDCPSVRAAVDGAGTFCHCGYSFLNVYPSEQRGVLLDGLTSIREIVALGFEIQNPFHYEQFEFGRWYEQPLSDGGLLQTRSSPLADGGRTLELRFRTGGEWTSVTDTLYTWSIEDCIAAGTARGWNTRVLEACYRPMNSAVPSHLFALYHRAEVC